MRIEAGPSPSPERDTRDAPAQHRAPRSDGRRRGRGRERGRPGGFYLLDEPEAALSPKRQLALLSIIKQSIEEDDCQYVIATHSPILLSYPEAAHWVFDERGIEEAAFEDLEHVQFTRDFLAAPKRYWRHL